MNTGQTGRKATAELAASGKIDGKLKWRLGKARYDTLRKARAEQRSRHVLSSSRLHTNQGTVFLAGSM